MQLYENKNKNNPKLGKIIWKWLRDSANKKKTNKTKNTLWGKNANNIAADKLPYTATQFEFNGEKLNELYDYIKKKI